MELPKTHPQYNAKGINGGVYDKRGKLLYDVQSAEAWEFPDDERIFLKNLKINLYHESSDMVTYNLTSANGWINYTTKVGQLGESSILTVANPDPSQVITMYGKNINVNMESNIFSSEDDAHAIQGKNSVYTHGFSYDNNKHFLVLNSKVRVVYVK